MHGDEVVGREITISFTSRVKGNDVYSLYLFVCFFDKVYIYLIELLCSQYGVNDRITRLVNETDIFIIPTMNPDGKNTFFIFLS